MFCTNCGARNSDSAKFCTSCGAALEPVSVPISMPQTKPYVQPPTQTEPTSDTLADPVPTKPEKKHSKIRVIVLLIAAIALVAGVAAAAILTNGFGLLSVNVKPSTNDYTWDELSRISAQISACENNQEALEVAKSYNLTNPDGTLDGTQVKQLELADGTTSEVRIIGFYHDDKSDGSGKAGITFEFVDAIGQHAMNSNGLTDGGWQSSEMRSWMNSELINQLPGDLCSKIVPVNKLTNCVGFTADPTSVTATSDKLWLLSQIELVGPSDGSSPAYYGALDCEGTQYQLYSDQGIVRGEPASSLQKNLATAVGVSSVSWWQRSSAADYNENFYFTEASGDAFWAGSAAEELSVAPCFCL